MILCFGLFRQCGIFAKGIIHRLMSEYILEWERMTFFGVIFYKFNPKSTIKERIISFDVCWIIKMVYEQVFNKML